MKNGRYTKKSKLTESVPTTKTVPTITLVVMTPCTTFSNTVIEHTPHGIVKRTVVTSLDVSQ